MKHSVVTPHLAKAAGGDIGIDATNTLLMEQNAAAGHDNNIAVTYLERIAGGKATLYLMGLDLSYRPPSGFAAASMDVRAFKLACRSAATYKPKPNSACNMLMLQTCSVYSGSELEAQLNSTAIADSRTWSVTYNLHIVQSTCLHLYPLLT